MARQVVVPAWDSEVPAVLSAICGWCRTGVQLKRPHPPIEFWRREPGRYGGTHYTHREVRVGATFVCPLEGCRKPSLILFELMEMGDGYQHQRLATFPRGSAQKLEGLSDSVARDRDEAWSCFYGGDVRAAVIMGRAALQRAVRELGAKGDNLLAEIDDLLAKQVITSSLAKLAHEVRLAGNDAAHPETLEDVDPEDANESLVFLDEFLTVTLSMPARVGARSARRESKG